MEKEIQHIVYGFWADEDGAIYHKANLADLTWAVKSLARVNRKMKEWFDKATDNPDHVLMPDKLPTPEDMSDAIKDELLNCTMEAK